jgi:hypothetical protein
VVGTLSYSLDLSIGPRVVGGYAGFLGNDYKDYLDFFGAKRALFLGYGAGVFATIGFIDLIAIQPEVMIFGIGCADKDSSDNIYLYRSHHVSPAVLIKARLGMINLLAGPMVMFKIGSGKEGWKYSDGTKDIIDMADDDVASIIFAATAGFGVEYPIAIGSLIAELRALYAFTSYWNKDVYTDVWNPFAVMVAIGYSYHIIK